MVFVPIELDRASFISVRTAVMVVFTPTFFRVGRQGVKQSKEISANIRCFDVISQDRKVSPGTAAVSR